MMPVRSRQSFTAQIMVISRCSQTHHHQILILGRRFSRHISSPHGQHLLVLSQKPPNRTHSLGGCDLAIFVVIENVPERLY